MISRFITLILLCLSMEACSQGTPGYEKIICGAERMEDLLPLIEGKRIGIVANQTSIVANKHLVDTLLNTRTGINRIFRVFSPEHGFRGNIEDGALIGNEIDKKTGIPVFSLYGREKELATERIEDLDIILFDLQDAGARFYTYISTMHYVMRSCARAGKKLIILDRPNPNGNYVDGPVLRPEFSSFVGIHPIPVVHGLTIGELALMINGEGWLGEGLVCDLKVITCKNYTHEMDYSLPVSPSPNLPNHQAIRLYPSLAFFEGTKVSIGRGTEFPFQVVGHPGLNIGDFTFTPVSKPGFSTRPPCEGQLCKGIDLREYRPAGNAWNRINLGWLILAYQSFEPKNEFFSSYFDKLAGTDQLRKDIENGLPEKEIRKKWETEIKEYLKLRERYLLYP